MTQQKRISRRDALARLGVGAASVYVSPSLWGISQARAASSASDASGSSDASDASDPSAPSPATPPSPPSAVSSATPPSAPSAPSGASQPSGPSQPSNRNTTSNPAASGPSGPGVCGQTTLPGGAQITRDDYDRAQQAIARGDARPLRDVLNNVKSQQPGRLLRVTYAGRGRSAAFRVVIVNPSGAIVSVTVDAKSGRITDMQNC